MSRLPRFLVLPLAAVGMLSLSGLEALGQRPEEMGRYPPRALTDLRSNSHGPIPGDGKLDSSKMLPQRLDRARQAAQAQELLRNTQSDPEFLRKWLEGLDDEKRKALMDLAQSVNKGQVELGANHSFLDQLNKVLPDLENPNRPLPPVSDELLNELKDLSQKFSPENAPAGKPDGSGDAAPMPDPGGLGKPAAGDPLGLNGLTENGADAERQAKWAKWLLNQVGDHPELRGIIEELARVRPGGSGMGDTFGDEILRKVESALPESSFWTDKVLPKLRDLPLPSFSGVKLPDVHVAPPSLPSVNMPSFAVPATPSFNVGYGWLAVPMLFLLGVLGWKLFQDQAGRKGLRWSGRSDGEESWRLGPWPVAPGSVASRADLIRAFEHLTLLKLGPEARSWNHLDIAAVLGGEVTERRQAAERLAALYERARYAPERESLPADALPSARRELVYLAEGAVP